MERITLHDMAAKTDPQLDVNSWLQDELRDQYHHDRTSIDEEWKQLFETKGTPKSSDTTNGITKPSAPVTPTSAPPAIPAAAPSTGLQAVARTPQTPTTDLTASEELQPLRGAAGAIAKNMNACVSIPLASSQRIVPVKVIE
jgi:2-oxoglutarate decarboxylase